MRNAFGKTVTAGLMLTLTGVAAGSVFYGKASGTGASLDQTIAWYADEACTSTQDVVSPYAQGASSHEYVILGSSKVQASSTFPDVKTYMGTDGVTVGAKVEPRHEWNMNGAGDVYTFPRVTVFSSYFRVNSSGMAKFLGDYAFATTSETIEFGGINIQPQETRGAELAGTFSSPSDVTVLLSGTMASKVLGVSKLVLSGDFSAFKGSFRTVKPTFVNQYTNGRKIVDVWLSSETALGDSSFPRQDALVLVGETRLTMSSSVAQGQSRGITLELSDGESTSFNADAGARWALTAPLYGSSGTLVKEGPGTVALDGAVEIGRIAVTEGMLELGSGFTFADGLTIAVAAGATLRSYRGLDGIAVTAEPGAVVQDIVHALPSYDDNYNRWVLPTTEKDADGNYLWSDHRAAHGGADYLIDTGMYVVSGNSGWHDEMIFPGKSLTLENGSRYVTRAVVNVISNLTLGAGVRVMSAGCAWGDVPHRMVGRYTIMGTEASPSLFVGNKDTGRKTGYQIEAELTGSGWLQFGGGGYGADCHIYSTNAAFAGVVMMGIGATVDEPQAIRFRHPQAFGGPLAAFNPKGVCIASAHSGLKPLETMTFDTPNRGVFFGEVGDFVDTPSDVTFTLKNPVRMVKGMRKKGDGVLSICGATTFGSAGNAEPNGANNKFEVQAGYLKADTADAYERLALSFAEGTGIAVEAEPTDDAVRQFGLQSSAAGRFVANGALKVKLIGADEALAARRSLRTVVCTVAAGTPDMTFNGVRPAHYRCVTEKETLSDGRIRYSVTWEPSGLTVILR